MSEIEITGENIAAGNEANVDVEMGGDEVVEVEAGATVGEQNGDGENGLPVPDEEDEAIPARVTYLDHLKSPIVELAIGRDDDQILLTAHQALLVQSPFFENACAQFDSNSAV